MIFFLILACYGLYQSIIIENKGNIITINLEAWEDIECTKRLTMIDWGELYNGEEKNFTFYLTISDRNGTLDYFVDDWSPSNVSNYVNIIFLNKGESIVAGEVKEVTLKIKIDEEIPPSFTSFECNIYLIAYIPNDL
ncbi:MAG: hypothetical protein DRI61_00290 [Chloroflexi bacterium]|nr:MAG: hypothetical protein DRI61_00290 [Chloroflexota bacterium]